MSAVRGVSVPMYTALRRTTVVFTMAMERLIMSTTHTVPVMGRSVPAQKFAWYLPQGYTIVVFTMAMERLITSTTHTVPVMGRSVPEFLFVS